MVRRRSGPPRTRATDADLGRALEAMTAPELRAPRSMLDSMRVAAERRVDGILARSRRRRYGHAAMLVAQALRWRAAAMTFPRG